MIKRVGRAALLGAALFVSAWLVWPRSPAAGQAERIPSPRGEAEKIIHNGVASCASMACHHFNGAKGSERSEYSTWSACDKHARAHAVLENERSARIVKNFYYTEDDPKPATQQAFCLKCHSTYSDDMLVGDRFHVSDGVGCESCHGASGKYLTVHYQGWFKGLSAESKEKDFGLKNTKNLNVRAQLCTTCHVGDGSKEVNHDLIAAGHPRLNFELAGYHAIYQKHWNERTNRDPSKNQPVDFEARLWMIGQLTTAKAAVDLLAIRAGQEGKTGPDGRPRPWPEFAEYACYACHKNLGLLDDEKPLQAKYKGALPGTFPYGTWYFSMVPPLADRLAEGGGGLNKDISDLKDLMKRPGGNTAAIAEKARATSADLEKLLKSIDKGPLDEATLRRYARSFAQYGEKEVLGMNWDEASQLYLSLAAFQQALLERGNKAARSGQLIQDLRPIRKILRNAFPTGVDSPQNFKPTQTLSDQLQMFREHLGN